MRGSLRDTSYMEHDRRRDGEGHGFWEPSTWADVALPLARYISHLPLDKTCTPEHGQHEGGGIRIYTLYSNVALVGSTFSYAQ